jgi:hypothetical protein
VHEACQVVRLQEGRFELFSLFGGQGLH